MDPSEAENAGVEFRLYKKRYVIFALTFAFVTLTLIPYAQYASITNVLVEYYNVSDYDVNMLSVIYGITYIVAVIPVNLISRKFGIRITVIFSMVCLTIGSIMKYIAVQPNLYWLALTGQTLASLSTIYSLSCQPHVVLTWFSPKESGKLISALVLPIFFGLGMGMLISSLLVADVFDNQIITTNLGYFMLAQAILNTVVLILIIIFFDERPETAPSISQHLAYEHRESVAFISTVKSLATNKDYILLLISSGIIIAIYNSMFTLLNQLITQKFHKSGESAGIIGALFVTIGCVTALVLGQVTTFYNKLKRVYAFCNFYTLIAMSLFTGSFFLDKIWPFYITSAILGLAFACNVYLALHFSAEIAYPDSEAISSGIVIASQQLLTIAYTPLGTMLIDNYSVTACNLFYVASIALVVIVDYFIKGEQRRDETETDRTRIHVSDQ